MARPDHHRPDGRFRNPWPEAAGDDALRARFREVAWEWFTRPSPPRPSKVPVAEPSIARPCVDGTDHGGGARLTWVGHATFLIQLPDLNLLTDPIWSRRASPVWFIGSKRFVPAVPVFEALPPIHAVLLSHDHYDHLDRPTVRMLHERFGDDLTWVTPLGFKPWFSRLGIDRVVECDWWNDALLPGGGYRAISTPARHWGRRKPWDTNTRLWCSWAIVPEGAQGPKIFFAGDSAYSTVFEEIGRRVGPFDASLLPIGAYEPRWFMSASHMNPEEAVRAYRNLGGTGVFVPTHWGTFRLTLEVPLEPPERTRAAWSAAGLAAEALEILRHGETLTLGAGAARAEGTRS